MANERIGAMRATLGFDTSQFEHGSKRARQIAKTDMGSIKADLSAARAAITGLGAAWVSSEVIQGVKRALDYSTAIKSVASETGLTMKQLQEYRYAAAQVGVAQGHLEEGMREFTLAIGEARAGTKDQATAFRDLGVSLNDGVTKRALNAAEVFPRLADALSRIKDPTARAQMGIKLFGEEYLKVDALVMQGSAGINRLAKEAHQLGIVMGDDLVTNADRAAKKLEAVKAVLDARFASVVAQNAGAIVQLGNAFAWAADKALLAFQNFSNFRNVRGLFYAGSTEAARTLFSTKSGAQAARDEAAARIADNQAARQNPANSAATNAAYDREFRALVNVRNQAIAAYRRLEAQEKAAQATSIPAPGALPIPDAGGSRRQPKAPKDRTEENTQRFRDELAGLYDDELGMQRDLATDLRERARIEHERIATAKEAYDRDVDSRVKQGELTQAQADALKLQRERNYDREKQQINWSLGDALAAEETRTAREGLDRERDMLAIRAGLATTASERRAIQLELLDKDLAIARLAADEVLARHDSTEAERKIAQAKIDQLDQLRQGETLRINRDTMGPLETYLDSIPDTVDEINEAYENLAVTGLRSFNDGLATSAANVLRLKGVAGQLFNQLIADLIRFQIQQAMGGSGGFFGSLFKLGGSLLGLGGGNPLAGSLDVASSNIAGMAANLDQRVLSGFSFAGGGDMTILGRRGIDRNVLSLNGLPIANVSYGERISIANDNPSPRMGSVVYVMPSPYFDARVDQRAYGVAAPIGMQAATAGSSGAQVAITRSGARQIP